MHGDQLTVDAQESGRLTVTGVIVARDGLGIAVPVGHRLTVGPPVADLGLPAGTVVAVELGGDGVAGRGGTIVRIQRGLLHHPTATVESPRPGDEPAAVSPRRSRRIEACPSNQPV